MSSTAVIERRLRFAILIYLWAALLEDTSLFLIAWLLPDVWFQYFHGVAPVGLDIAFLRRSAGQWAAFALAQGITLWCWRKNHSGLSLLLECVFPTCSLTYRTFWPYRR